MTDIDQRDPTELYRALILDHGRSPRNAALPQPCDASAERDNPLCGDRVTFGARFRGEMIEAAGFDADGCLLSVAAASLVCESLRGQSAKGAIALCAQVLALIAERAPAWPAEVGVLGAFAPVRQFPARGACVGLICKAVQAALSGLQAR